MSRSLFRLLILLAVLVPFNVKASCDNARLSDLSSIAGNIQFSTTYRLEGSGIVYNVEASNITNDVYVVDNFGNTFTASSYVLDYTTDGTITYDVYSNDPNCWGERLLFRSVTLTPYNRFSTYPECSDRPSNRLCKMWGEMFAIDDTIFRSEIADSDLSDDSKMPIADETTDNANNGVLFYGGIAILFALMIVLFFVVRRRKK